MKGTINIMAVKFYAVKVGRTTGIFNTWDECKKQVDGFGGAIYKSFPTAKEAMEYLGWGSSNSNADNNISKDTAIAYVDGSFNISTGEFEENFHLPKKQQSSFPNPKIYL